MKYGNLDIVVDKFVINTQQRLLNVVAQSIKSVVDDAQTPVAKGGKMRVDTGFLRSSGVSAINLLPVGPTKGDSKAKYQWASDSLEANLARLKIGDVFNFGWTARYAQYREAYDGFLEAALQKWQYHVDKAVAFYKDKDFKK